MFSQKPNNNNRTIEKNFDHVLFGSALELSDQLYYKITDTLIPTCIFGQKNIDIRKHSDFKKMERTTHWILMFCTEAVQYLYKQH